MEKSVLIECACFNIMLFITSHLEVKDYYKIFFQVQQKLKTDTYEDIEELTSDIELLVNNAKAFYKPDSVEYKDAIELWKIYMQNKQALENGEIF